MARAPRREKSLDALRAVAIALVVLFHYTTNGMPPDRLTGPASYLMTLVSLGWAGVDLFFVLSGFLIGGILIDNREADNFFAVFYLRRATRILPLYLLAVALAYWQAPEARTPAALLCLLIFTQNFWMAHHGGFEFGGLNVTWSLALEAQFYLAAPLIVRWLPPRRLPAASLALIALAPVCRALIWLEYPPGHEWVAAYLLPFARMDCFAMGILLAYTLHQGAWRRWALAHLSLLLGAAAVSGFLAIAMVFTGHTWRDPLFSIFGLTLVPAACSGLLVLFATRKGPVSTLLFRLLAPLGAGAYSIYLFHVYAPELAARLFDWGAMGGLAQTAVLVGSNLLLAGLLWNLVEKPLVALGHRARFLPAASEVRIANAAQGAG